MEHKHAALIKRWADDTSLVILVNIESAIPYEGIDKWGVSSSRFPPRWYENLEYFLVCKKHKEVALHWLNGGDIEFKIWLDVSELDNIDFQEVQEYRIKPKFETIKV